MVIWLSYIIGQAFHILAKASVVIVNPGAPINSLRGYIVKHWITLAIRGFLATVGLLYWQSNPDILNVLAKGLAAHLNPGTIRTVIESVALPLNPATAALYGYFADSLLDKLLALVPGLHKWIPSLNNQAQNKSKSAGTQPIVEEKKS